jgi:hypothetical protein
MGGYCYVTAYSTQSSGVFLTASCQRGKSIRFVDSGRSLVIQKVLLGGSLCNLATFTFSLRIIMNVMLASVILNWYLGLSFIVWASLLQQRIGGLDGLHFLILVFF